LSTIAVADSGRTVDVSLIQRAQAGDAAAFEALVRPRLDRCFRIAWAVLSSDADAADAMQEALVAVWRQLPRLRDPAAFEGWLNRVVANAAITQRRKRGRRKEVQVRESVADSDPISTAAFESLADQAFMRDDTDRIAERDAISSAFQRVRPEDRALLVLHHVDGRSVAEIARMLAVPTGTAKWRLHQARRAFERAMEVEE
jgi:RNA polymerase sigma-70 factor, ECF subfamily